MNLFIITCFVIGIIVVYFNRNFIKNTFQEHFSNNYKNTNSNDPLFCFDCNLSVCDTCEALKLWKDGKKGDAIRVFHDHYRNK